MKDSRCPICGCLSHDILHKFSKEDVCKHFFKNSSSNESEKEFLNSIVNVWKADTSELRKCSDCDFVFSFPFVSGSTEFYSLAYPNKSEYPKWKWDYQEFFNHVSTLQNNKLGEFLEIGAGNGALIHNVKARNIDISNISAVEFSDYSLSCLNEMGVETYSVPIDQLSVAEHFDTVVMFQVLEHLDRLDSVFNSLRSITSDKAIIHITVPNKKTRLWFMKNGLVVDIPPCHISIWEKKDFERVCENYGFELLVFEEQISKKLDIYKRVILDKFLFKTISGSFLRKMKKGWIKRLVGMFFIFSYSVLNLKILLDLMINNYGISSYVVLRKKN